MHEVAVHFTSANFTKLVTAHKKTWIMLPAVRGFRCKLTAG